MKYQINMEKNLTLEAESYVFISESGAPCVSSFGVAAAFGIKHSFVLCKIDRVLKQNFLAHSDNFIAFGKLDVKNRYTSGFLLTLKAFRLLLSELSVSTTNCIAQAMLNKFNKCDDNDMSTRKQLIVASRKIADQEEELKLTKRQRNMYREKVSDKSLAEEEILNFSY